MRSPEAVAIMACPVCKTGLALSVRADIEIDYCPSCRGVWLDRGELDKILERSALPVTAVRSPPPQPDMRGYGHRYDDDRRHYGKRPKSFLAELFD